MKGAEVPGRRIPAVGIHRPYQIIRHSSGLYMWRCEACGDTAGFWATRKDAEKAAKYHRHRSGLSGSGFDKAMDNLGAQGVLFEEI